MDDTRIRMYILKELSKLRFSLHNKGGMYLIDAIFICIKDERAIENLNQNVYSVIADKYHAKTMLTVKAVMQHSIETMYRNMEEAKVKKYFYLETYEKPTLKRVIGTVVFKYGLYEQRYLTQKVDA